MSGTAVAGILLAAGGGSRLGRPKALVEFDGQTLAERGVATLRAGGADPVLVVSGAVPVSVPGAQTVHNPDWETGMGSSLAVALRAVDSLEITSVPDNASPETAASARTTSSPGTSGSPDAASPDTDPASGAPSSGTTALPAAAVIALADQPLVGAEAVRRLIAAWRDGASVAVAAYDGKPRNPVLIAREHWPAVLETATGDRGARAFLRAHPDLVTLVECGDTGRPDDIDTAEDLARITRLDRPADEPGGPGAF
jgi:CTP:molybdopterin cytidylyltransferase MocA